MLRATAGVKWSVIGQFENVARKGGWRARPKPSGGEEDSESKRYRRRCQEVTSISTTAVFVHFRNGADTFSDLALVVYASLLHRLKRDPPPESQVLEGHFENTESLVNCCYRHPLPAKCPRPISTSLSQPPASFSSTAQLPRRGKPRRQVFPTSRKSNHSHSRPVFPVGLPGTPEEPPADRQATTPHPLRWLGRSMSADAGKPSPTSQADRFETPLDTGHQGRRQR